MSEKEVPQIAIIDYGMGNVLNVKRACSAVGMRASVTFNKDDILASDAVILPGVGAFGDAMEALRKFDLVQVLRDFIKTGKPLLGICLGMQLLMSKSYEFGEHEGLGIVPGEVVFFDAPKDPSGGVLKVPQVGWNRIHAKNKDKNFWKDTLYEGLDEGQFMYFVHSYYVKPDDASVCVSVSNYGDVEFCSGLKQGNIFAMQFHPEKSGTSGLEIYSNFKNVIEKNKKENCFVKKN